MLSPIVRGYPATAGLSVLLAGGPRECLIRESDPEGQPASTALSRERLDRPENNDDCEDRAQRKGDDNGPSAVPERLTQIDDLLRLDHDHLRATDECWSIWEYTPGKGFSHSPANQIIWNLKKGTELRGTGQWYYKERAIEFSGRVVAAAIGSSTSHDVIFVPTPPSAAKADPAHDDRMLQILDQAKRQRWNAPDAPTERLFSGYGVRLHPATAP